MYKDAVIVDSVVHAFNRTPENERNEFAREFTAGTFRRHQFSPEKYQMSRKKWETDCQPEELERMVYLESDVDYAIFQSLPLTDYYKDGHVALDKGIDFRESNPERAGLIAGINPLADDAKNRLEHLVNEVGIDGIKIYPARYENGETLPVWLNDPDGARPVIEHALDLGIDHIAVHKAIPTRLTHQKYFKTEDVEEAAADYPDVTFTLVHAGYSFVEETTSLLTRFDNVYANLETTMVLMLGQPRQFGKSLGEMLLWAGSDKLLFGSGVNAYHPQMLIEEFWDYQMPQELQDEYGYPKLTEEDKKRILGLNACEVFGIDPDALRERSQNDRWAQTLEEEGRPAPWSSLSA